MESTDSAELNLQESRVRTDTGPFVLRGLLDDLPLSADGDRDDIEINCVEFLGMCVDLAHFETICTIS